MYLKMYLLLYLFMPKKMQTFKLSDNLITELQKASKKKKLPFNRYCEEVLSMFSIVDYLIVKK